MDHNLKDPFAYVHACRSTVPIELEAASYNGDPYVRSRVAARTNRVHVLEHLAMDNEPMVVANVLANPLAPKWAIEFICYRMIHTGYEFDPAWYFAMLNPMIPLWLYKYFYVRAAEYRASIRKKLKLRMPKPMLTQEERAILSILDAYRKNKKKRKNKRVPWGITPIGWKCYTTHWSKRVRNAARRHPKCPARFRSKET